MVELSIEQVREIARLAGIELDNQRAEAIAARLGRVLTELAAIPNDALADVEPGETFVTEPEGLDG